MKLVYTGFLVITMVFVDEEKLADEKGATPYSTHTPAIEQSGSKPGGLPSLVGAS